MCIPNTAKTDQIPREAPKFLTPYLHFFFLQKIWLASRVWPALIESLIKQTCQRSGSRLLSCDAKSTLFRFSLCRFVIPKVGSVFDDFSTISKWKWHSFLPQRTRPRNPAASLLYGLQSHGSLLNFDKTRCKEQYNQAGRPSKSRN